MVVRDSSSPPGEDSGAVRVGLRFGWVRGSRRSVGTNGKLKAGDAMILQDRDLDIRDLRIRQKDEPLIAAGEPDASLDGAEFQGVEPLAGESHNLEAYMRVVVLTAELPNSLGEGPAEERHVEHRHDANRRRREVSVFDDFVRGRRRQVRERRRGLEDAV
jgi:hypothetical protein